MMNLIAVLIVAALTAILSTTTMYLLGDSFNSGSDRAENLRLNNGGGQIAVATHLYITQNGGTPPESLDVLVTDGYLKSLPKGISSETTEFEWSYNFDNFVSVGVDGEAMCLDINEAAGDDSGVIPSCADDYDGAAPCCTTL